MEERDVRSLGFFSEKEFAETVEAVYAAYLRKDIKLNCEPEEARDVAERLVKEGVFFLVPMNVEEFAETEYKESALDWVDEDLENCTDWYLIWEKYIQFTYAVADENGILVCEDYMTYI